jgi:hypothetical protein
MPQRFSFRYFNTSPEISRPDLAETSLHSSDTTHPGGVGEMETGSHFPESTDLHARIKRLHPLTNTFGNNPPALDL